MFDQDFFYCFECLGNLFTYHANLLNQQKRPEILSQADKKQEAGPLQSQDAPVKRGMVEDNYRHVDDCSSITDKLFEEAQDLLFNSPWILDSALQEI